MKTIKLVELAQSTNLVGSVLGQLVNTRLQSLPSACSLALSFEGAGMVDATFLREAVVRLIKVISPKRGVVVTDMQDSDHLDNLIFVAVHLEQPVTLWSPTGFKCIGKALSPPLQKAVDLILREKSIDSVRLAAVLGTTVQCASTNLANLHRKGYVNRSEFKAPTGGIGYCYIPFGADLLKKIQPDCEYSQGF